jgi:NAD(P)-dependent dehydrogenase (short-subunit alcohol dehydrogenase family)
MDMDKVALVTGVSSGIGRSAAEALRDAGFVVFGTTRSGRGAPQGVQPVQLDVRDEKSVQAAVATAAAHNGRIDVLVNNAGGGLTGAVEETSIAEAQALFDVNFFGAARVTDEVLPIMRKAGSGRVVFVSSVVGFLPAPYMGYYAASKHALEALAESLDHEIRSFGVRAVLVEPSFTKTRIDESGARATHALAAYAPVRARMAESLAANIAAGDAPEEIARVIVRAATAKTPKARYPVGKGAGTLHALRRYLPRGMFDKAFRKRFHLDEA